MHQSQHPKKNIPRTGEPAEFNEAVRTADMLRLVDNDEAIKDISLTHA